MQKVYLLLRNNCQQGPFSIDELASNNLKPDDLIWVEGKSLGWAYPYEIEALRNILPASFARPQKEDLNAKVDPAKKDLPSASGKIFVSLPGNLHQQQAGPTNDQTEYDLERRAAQIRSRAEAYVHEQDRADDWATKTNYSRSLNDAEEEYTAWAVKTASKRKKPISRKIILCVTTICIVVCGYFIVPSLFNTENVSVPVKSKESNFQNDVALNNTAQPAEGTAADDRFSENENLEPQIPKDAQNPVARKSEAVHKNTSTTARERISKIEPVRTSIEPTVEDEDQSTISTDLPKDQSSGSEPVVESKEKKKTLKERIGNFFGKIKNKSVEEQEVSKEDEKASTKEGGERRASRRGGDSETGEVVDLSSSARVTLNIPSGDWMMGVRGAKVTLRNIGNESISKASVEVRYYNEQNELVDKKLLYFSNIAAKKTVSQSAPDHRTADHAEAVLLSASGDIGYAKQ